MTSHMKRNHELEEKLPLYALDALEDAEMKEIEQYIQHFPDVVAELKKLRDAADLLPMSTPLRTPPSNIKMAVLNHAKANPREHKAELAEQESVVPLKPQRPITKPATPPESSTWQVVQEWWRSLKSGPALPVAFALSLLAIGFVSNRLLSTLSQVAVLESQVSNLESKNEQLGSTNAVLNSEVITLSSINKVLVGDNEKMASASRLLENENSELVLANQTLLAELDSNEQLISYAADANSQRYALPGTDAQPGASGGLFIRPDTGELLLVISQLEPLTEDQIYQLWLIEDQPMSAGLIKITPEGTGIFEIDVALDQIDFSAVGVSIEPAGGSELPTGDIVMFAEI